MMMVVSERPQRPRASSNTFQTIPFKICIKAYVIVSQIYGYMKFTRFDPILTLHRGHSRNRRKGGCKSLQRYTSTRFIEHFFSVFTHKEFRGLFKELYPLYFVQNLAKFIALDWMKDIK